MDETGTAKSPRRLLAIGDIHGCHAQLHGLLEQVSPTVDDQVVFLGDYIDRGPQSAQVIEELISFGKEHPQTIFLRGNHEQMFSHYLAGVDSIAFMLNGGAKTLLSYQQMNWWPLPGPHGKFFAALQNSFATDEFIFVHAGLRPGLPLARQKSCDLLWIRRDFIDSDYDWGKTIVYGHTPVQEPFISKTRLGLDTGCVYGRKLTCCDVLTRQIWQG